MKDKFIRVLLATILILSLCSCKSGVNTVTKEVNSYKVDTESYKEMIENLMLYTSTSEDASKIIRDNYRDYVTDEAFRQLKEYSTNIVLQSNGTDIAYYAKGDMEEGEYPIYDEYGDIAGRGTYEEYKGSYNNYNQIPLNQVGYIDQYDNMLMVMVVNKYNGSVFMRFRIDNDGLLSDVAFLK